MGPSHFTVKEAEICGNRPCPAPHVGMEPRFLWPRLPFLFSSSWVFFFFNFWCETFLSLYWICYNIVSVLCFGFLGCKWDLTSLFSSVQFSCSVMSDSLWPHESQHARPPCPSPTPRVHPNSHPSSRWCHPAISSSVVPFSSCPQSLPASESFPMSQLFTWDGQSIGLSASASVLPKNT